MNFHPSLKQYLVPESSSPGRTLNWAFTLPDLHLLGAGDRVSLTQNKSTTDIWNLLMAMGSQGSPGKGYCQGLCQHGGANSPAISLHYHFESQEKKKEIFQTQKDSRTIGQYAHSSLLSGYGLDSNSANNSFSRSQTQRQDSMKSREIENAVRPNYVICQPHTCFLLYLSVLARATLSSPLPEWKEAGKGKAPQFSWRSTGTPANGCLSSLQWLRRIGNQAKSTVVIKEQKLGSQRVLLSCLFPLKKNNYHA